MKPYFSQADRQAALIETSERWLGIPYRHAGESRTGTDCAKFLALILVDLGVMTRLEPGIIYPRDFAQAGQDVIVGGFRRHGEKYMAPGLRLELFRYSNSLLLLPGDVLMMATGRVEACNHAGLYLGRGKFVHCLEKKGVYVADLSDHWRPKVRQFFRVYHGD